MTLQQLKYVVTVAETGTITEAAGKLYISQPSLTNAIHELEREMQIVIDKKLNGKDIIAVPLADESDMRIGYITHRKGMLSRLGTTYLDALSKYIG